MKDNSEIIDVIIRYCEAIDEDLTLCNDIEDFLNSDCIQRSCSFSIIQIGEFVKRLSDEFTSSHNEINWSEIARYRDFITHNYVRIDKYALWNTITEDIPILERYLKSLKNDMEKD